MNKKHFYVLTAVVIILLGSCVNTISLGVFDETVPEDQLCNLLVSNNLTIVMFNNRPVIWTGNDIDRGRLYENFTIDLPPGEHTFVVSYAKNAGGYAWTESETITHTFEPGKKYQIYLSSVWAVLVTITNVKIKEVK